MSEAVDTFLELQRRLRAEKDKGEDANLSLVAETEIAVRNAFEKLSDEEKESLRLQRRVTHIEGEPGDKTFAGFTEVVEVFVGQRQPNGEIMQMRLPGDLMAVISGALHEAMKAVGEDFVNHDVCRRLIADDPRLEIENLCFEFNFAQGLLQNHR
jgi:hypothetical protein